MSEMRRFPARTSSLKRSESFRTGTSVSKRDDAVPGDLLDFSSKFAKSYATLLCDSSDGPAVSLKGARGCSRASCTSVRPFSPVFTPAAW